MLTFDFNVFLKTCSASSFLYKLAFLGTSSIRKGISDSNEKNTSLHQLQRNCNLTSLILLQVDIAADSILLECRYDDRYKDHIIEVII